MSVHVIEDLGEQQVVDGLVLVVKLAKMVIVSAGASLPYGTVLPPLRAGPR